MAADTVKTSGKVFDAQNMNANATSSVIDIQMAKHIGIDLHVNNASTNSAGNIQVKISNSYLDTYANWVAVEFSDGTSQVDVAASANTDVFLDLADIAAKYMRLDWTANSGQDGQLTAIVHCKGL